MAANAGESRSRELSRTLLDLVLQQVCELAGFDHATFCRWESAGLRTLTVLGASGSLTHPEVTVTGRTLDAVALGYDLTQRETGNLDPVVINLDGASPGMHAFLTRVGASAFASVPVVDPSGGLWLLEGWRVDKRRELGDGEIAELRRFAALSAAVLAHDDMAAALAEAAGRWQRLVEQIPAITYIATPDGDPIYSSPQVQTLLGLRADQWDVGHERWLEIVHPDDRERIDSAFRGLAEHGRYLAEYRILSPDGRTHWFTDRAVYIPADGDRPAQVQGVMVDVTARKQAESALSASELRREHLLAEMLRAEETERSRIAEELHDDTIQVMTAALIQIDRLLTERERAGGGDGRQVLDQVRTTIADAIERTRRMTFRLRPPLLQAQGLTAAIQVLADDVREGSGTAVELAIDLPRLGSGIEELVFRTVQEALTNVTRHARAPQATVQIGLEAGMLSGAVADTGAGFDVAAALDRSRMRMHLGLEAMRERLHLAGGGLTIDSAPGAGTTIGFWLPLPAAAEPYG